MTTEVTLTTLCALFLSLGQVNNASSDSYIAYRLLLSIMTIMTPFELMILKQQDIDL
jgi:hypothetical protein